MVGARRNPEEQPLKGGGAGPRQWKVKIDRNLRLRVNWWYARVINKTYQNIVYVSWQMGCHPPSQKKSHLWTYGRESIYENTRHTFGLLIILSLRNRSDWHASVNIPQPPPVWLDTHGALTKMACTTKKLCVTHTLPTQKSASLNVAR